ncbi:MAG TPA: hypothetical protein VF465_21150 [Flavobacterium sp.]|uniref:hypothetical protein n=1 Tax=Flavobacterium sp. TaxID=239 RepID=UPI002ED30D57
MGIRKEKRKARGKIMDESKGDFYFRGKFFNTEEELFEYINQWRDMPLDQESCESMLRTLIKDLKMNALLKGVEFTNEEFYKYIDDVYTFAMSHLIKMGK